MLTHAATCDSLVTTWGDQLAGHRCTCALAERKRIATLEAALRPFAESPFSDDRRLAEPYEKLHVEGWFDDAPAPGSRRPPTYTGLTVGDLKRACAALAQPVGGGS